MKLCQLLSIYPTYRMGSHPTVDVSEICTDSRTAAKDSVFVAIRGHRFDAHNVLNEVVARQPAGLVVEDASRVPSGFSGAVVVVDDARVALNQIASRFYDEPASKLFCIGVTGTNGKTTVTHLVEAIFEQYGWGTGVMGTIDHHFRDRRWTSELTTPDTVVFYRRLAEFHQLGAKAVAMEVSSHALKQNRVDQVPIDVAVFTNLSRDHLDYHKTMDDYFESKQKLFRESLLVRPEKTFAVINTDDPYGKKMNVAERAFVKTYGRSGADFEFSVQASSFDGVRYHLKAPMGEIHIDLPMIGLFNVYNSVAAIAAATCAGVSLATCRDALWNFQGVPGRLYRVPNERDLHVFVDYAHTPDALTNVLESLAEVRGQMKSSVRIITVFGCGGDRDPGKRPMMAAAAHAGSDEIILTSDNPRTEDPLKIIEEMAAGLPSDADAVHTEPDRRKAIAHALQLARPGDVVLIAGKGHETYQIIGERKLPFDDAAVAKEILDGF